MQTFQLIEHGHQPAAIVIAGHAIISEHVAPADLQTVKAMCAYALHIGDGELPGPYRDGDAERYAQRELGRLTGPAPVLRTGRRAAGRPAAARARAGGGRARGCSP